MQKQIRKVLLAFSGGLDTSAIIPWLKETYGAEVIAYCSDLGNAPNAEWLKSWAFKLGATDFIFEDLKEDFSKNFAFKAILAGAIYQDDYLLGTALGRPLISERMAYYAKQFQCDAIAHGATGKGNDQLRFEKSWAYLVPDVTVIAPWKIWKFTGRSDLLAYLSERGFELSSTEKKYSVDVNLMHRSCEGGVLENPQMAYECDGIYEWTKTPTQLNRERRDICIEFKNGFAVSLNEKAMDAYPLLEELNIIAGDHGIGVVDLVEERANGIKSRGVYETPGGTLLHTAVKALKHLCWSRQLMTTARSLGQTYAELVYDGLWHSETRIAVDAFFESASRTLSGIVWLRLEGGQLRVLKRDSSFALYDEKSVSFEGDAHGLYQYAEGYCKTVSFSQLRAGNRDKKNNIQLI